MKWHPFLALGSLLAFGFSASCSSTVKTNESPGAGGSGGAGATSSGGAGASAGTAGTGAGGAGGTTGVGGTAGVGGAAGGSGGGSGGVGGNLCSAPELELGHDTLMEQVTLQGGFSPGECWGVTYDASAFNCSYRFGSVTLLVAGEGQTRSFAVQSWRVDVDGKPSVMLKEVVVDITPTTEALTQIDATDLNVPGFNDERFAIAVCHRDHGGAPSIASDLNGLTPGVNWVFTTDGWQAASDFGLGGDWIMRATVVPK